MELTCPTSATDWFIKDHVMHVWYSIGKTPMTVAQIAHIPCGESNPSPPPLQYQATLLPSGLKVSSHFNTGSSWSEACRKWFIGSAVAGCGRVVAGGGSVVAGGGRVVDFDNQGYPHSWG